jgi:hypothetical protein
VLTGDTIRVLAGGNAYVVSYLMTDAPGIDQPFGPEATIRNAELVRDQTLFLESDYTTLNEEGRLLRYVFLGNGVLVNRELIREGYARFSESVGNDKYAYLLREAQIFAMINGWGQWAPPTPTPTLTLTPTPTPLLSNPPTPTTTTRFDSGGLGVERLVWELSHNPTEAARLGFPPLGVAYDGIYDVLFRENNIWSIERQWPLPQAPELHTVQAEMVRLIPADSMLVRGYNVAGRDDIFVELLFSATLASRFSSVNWRVAQPGTFTVQYNLTNDRVTRMIITGDDLP